MEILQFVWDPTSEGFTIFGKFTIYYYSLMWMLAFILGFYIMQIIYKKEGLSMEKLDSLFVYTILGTMIGARLGHVIFYQIDLFDQDFFSVFLPFRFNPTFEFTGFRGLASHGANIGIITAMFIYKYKFKYDSVLWIFARIVIPISVGGMSVGIGNFFNSEIVGNYTNSNFGVVFKNNGEIFPRHPAQLYEAFGYLLLFILLWNIYWKTDLKKYKGFIFGLFLTCLFSIRVLVEYVKESQGGLEEYLGILSTGQWLSIPFILIGITLMIYSRRRSF